MRVTGYCVKCKKVKQVTVRPSGMHRGMVVGICRECEEKQR